ncbi:MAG: gluconate 2-dehydrogenase subunit 3 family protein [Sulfurimonas sp.]|nr:gluconate 2-dehydrogenase subunit 3 family protein [Sulfurimonas sp.]
MQSRRSFFKTTFLATSLLALTCKEVLALTTPLEILEVVQVDLFPQNMISNANAFAYLSLILKHSRVTQEDKDYLRNGTRWLNEESLKQYNKNYTQLSKNQRQKLLKIIAKESWGRGWIKTVLGYIMESTLGDPIYGINKNESGWKWLNHESGLPRPKEALL